MHPAINRWAVTPETPLYQAATLTLPRILPEHAVQLLFWSQKKATASFIHLDKTVPHIDFVKCLVADIPQVIDQGYRSVYLMVDGSFS